MSDLLRPDQLATEFDVSIRTIYRWIAHGKIRSIRIGRIVRISRAEFVRLCQSNDTSVSVSVPKPNR